MKYLVTVVATALVLTGCASVPTQTQELSDSVKQFKAPSDNNAGIYIYRKDSIFGAALKKDVWIGKDCVGQTASGVFFYREAPATDKLELSTESSFSANKLLINAKAGELYFVKQYITPGLVVGGANLELVTSDVGKAEIKELSMAKDGECSN